MNRATSWVLPTVGSPDPTSRNRRTPASTRNRTTRLECPVGTRHLPRQWHSSDYIFSDRRIPRKENLPAEVVTILRATDARLRSTATPNLPQHPVPFHRGPRYRPA